VRPAQRDHPFPIVAAAGSNERDAAAALFVSRSRIHSHIKSIYFKLGSSSRDEGAGGRRVESTRLHRPRAWSTRL